MCPGFLKKTKNQSSETLPQDTNSVIQMQEPSEVPTDLPIQSGSKRNRPTAAGWDSDGTAVQFLRSERKLFSTALQGCALKTV